MTITSTTPTHVLVYAIVCVSITLMLIRPKGIAEVYWIGSGAALLVLLRLTPWRVAGHAVLEGSDVYLFLIGMMLLSELARANGIFDWVSSFAVRSAGGSTLRLFTLIYGIGTLTTIFLSNDATAVVLTPAVLSAVRKAKVQPLPHLFACALIANAASLVLPISNPANLVVFQQHMPSLGRWLLSFGLPSILSIAATYLVMVLIFRADLRCAMEQDTSEAKPLPTSGRFVLAGLALVVVTLLIASARNMNLGLPTCVAAFVVLLAVCIRQRENPLKFAKHISWETLALVAGLFILVDAVQSVGALQVTQDLLERTQTLGVSTASLLIGFTVGVANNVVNNLPLGLIAGSTLQAAHPAKLLTNAVLIGVDLGPNLSVSGSLATILWLLALKKEKIEVSFWQFLRIGTVVMPVALISALGGAIVLQRLLHLQ